MSTLEENLRVAQPEIEPLHLKKKEENEQVTKVPINADVVADNDSVYNKTTVEKAPLKLRNLLKQVRQPSPYHSWIPISVHVHPNSILGNGNFEAFMLH